MEDMEVKRGKGRSVDDKKEIEEMEGLVIRNGLGWKEKNVEGEDKVDRNGEGEGLKIVWELEEKKILERREEGEIEK